jgi:hypothetical protein
VHIPTFTGYTVVQGTWGITVLNTTVMCAYVQNATGVAVNDEITFPVALSAGTWTIQMIQHTFTDRGIATFRLDGVSVGTIDGYSAGSVLNAIGSIAGVVVAASGKKVLSIKMATKNASSTNFNLLTPLISLVRTA